MLSNIIVDTALVSEDSNKTVIPSQNKILA